MYIRKVISTLIDYISSPVTLLSCDFRSVVFVMAETFDTQYIFIEIQILLPGIFNHNTTYTEYRLLIGRRLNTNTSKSYIRKVDLVMYSNDEISLVFSRHLVPH